MASWRSSFSFIVWNTPKQQNNKTPSSADCFPSQIIPSHTGVNQGWEVVTLLINSCSMTCNTVGSQFVNFAYQLSHFVTQLLLCDMSTASSSPSLLPASSSSSSSTPDTASFDLLLLLLQKLMMTMLTIITANMTKYFQAILLLFVVIAEHYKMQTTYEENGNNSGRSPVHLSWLVAHALPGLRWMKQHSPEFQTWAK